MINENKLIIKQLNKFGKVPQTHELLQMIERLEQENKQLKDNWNKLKECLKDVMNSSNGDDKDFVETILNIIQELEQGSDDDGNN